MRKFTSVATLLGVVGCGGDDTPSDGVEHLAEGAAEWPNALVSDGSSLYFTDLFSSAVHKVPKGGGKASRLYGSRDEFVAGTGIALDETNVYAAFDEGTVVRIPRDGGDPSILASGQRDVSSIVAHGDHVYWTVGYIPDVGGGSAIMTVGKGGGEPTVFVSGQMDAHALVAHGENVYWVANASILTVSATGGAPIELIANAQGAPLAMAIDGDEMFWPVRGTVAKAPLEGGSVELLSPAGTEPGSSDGIAVDDEFVYFADTQNLTVMRIPKAGGSPETINPVDALAEGMFVDDDALYFADATSRSIVRLPK